MEEEGETRTSIFLPDSFLRRVRADCVSTRQSVGRKLGSLAMAGMLAKACLVFLAKDYSWRDSRIYVEGGVPKRDLFREKLKKQNLLSGEVYQWLQDLKEVKENVEILIELLEERLKR